MAMYDERRRPTRRDTPRAMTRDEVDRHSRPTVKPQAGRQRCVREIVSADHSRDPRFERS